MLNWLLIPGTFLAIGSATAVPSSNPSPVIILPHNPLLHRHGRWDTAPGTWWAGSGFKLVASNLTSFTLHLGNHTTTPQTAVALSVDYADFTTINITAGANIIPIPVSGAVRRERAVRMNTEGWQNNRMDLESVELNPGAVIRPYQPSPLRFQFIGDSLSAGVYHPRGVNDAWTFLTAQEFKAEHSINAQPGACLTDQVCWGNSHGISYQYFRTEDTGYYYTTDHNYTTPWDFKRDLTPTHIVVAIGANDNAYQITNESFRDTLDSFIGRLRRLHRTQPIFVFTPWGWPNADGVSPFSLYYEGIYDEVVNKRISAGDKQVYLVNTTGWVGYDGVYPNDGHPNLAGQKQILSHFTTWLKEWGLQPRSGWES